MLSHSAYSLITIGTPNSSPAETPAPLFFKTRPKFKFCASPHLILASSMLLAPVYGEAALLEFFPSTLSVSEADGQMMVDIRLSREMGDYGGCIVNGTLGLAGTATPDTDYALATNFNVTLGSAAEDMSQTTSVALNIVDDLNLEANENIVLSLITSPSDCGLIVNTSPTPMTVEIVDNDQGGEPQNLESLSLTPPQRKVGAVLDQLCANSSSSVLRERCNGLSTLSANDKRAALQQIAPEEILVLGTLSLNAGSGNLSSLRNRLNTLRAQPADEALNRFSFQFAGLDARYQALADGLQQLNDAGTAPAPALAPSPWSVYFTTTLGESTKKATTLTSAFNADIYGLLVGADYRISNQWFAGSAVNFARTRAELGANAGDMKQSTAVLALYSSYYFRDQFYLDGVLQYGKENFDSLRNINYLGGDAKITGQTDGNQLSASIGGGMDAYPWDWNFNTYTRATYLTTDIDKFREQGSTGWEMQIGKQSVKSLTTVLGMRVAKSISTGTGVFTPGAHFEWQHEFGNDAREFSAHFLEDPSVPFTLQTNSPDRDGFNFGAGVVATLPGGRTAFLQAASTFGQGLVTQRRIDLGFRMEF